MGSQKVNLLKPGLLACMDRVTYSSDPILPSPYFMPPDILYLYNSLLFCNVVIFDE